MRLVGKLLSVVGAAFVYLCGATAIAEVIIVGSLWAAGGFEAAKVQRYAAIVYGFELIDLNIDGKQAAGKEAGGPVNRDELLESRVADNETLATRQEAIRRGADDIRILVQTLATKRERYEIVKGGFEDLLLQLERDVNGGALTEVRRTLEVLPSKQTKDLMIDMLRDGDASPEDDVLADVLAIIRGMPQDKLKKIFGEFKTEEERVILNQILLALGELDET